MRAFIVFFAFMMCNTFTLARAAMAPFTVGNTEIYFRVDGADAPLPMDIILRVAQISSGASLETIASELIHALGETKLYKDIVADKAIIDISKHALLVSAKSSWRISSLRIESAGGVQEDYNKFRVLISSQSDQYISSFLTLDHDALRIENALKSDGFLKARVKYSTREVAKGRISVTFIVDRGNPCLVANFVPLATPIRIFKNIASGDFCNKTTLANKFKEEEAKLRNQGYIYARIQFDPETDIVTSRDLERASLKYWYTPGEKWSLSIIDRDSGVSIEDEFMRSTGFVLGDLTFSSSDDLKEKILTYLRSLGYADATITFDDLAEEKSNEKKLVFEVDRGRKLYVNHALTEVVGDAPFTREQIVEGLGIQPGIFNAASGIPFVEANLKSMQESLTSYLVNLGYNDADVALPEAIRTTSSDKVSLRIRFKAGYRYRVNSIQLLGQPENFNLNNSLVDEYFEGGNALQPGKVTKLQETILNELFSMGYRKAQISDPDISCRGTQVKAGAKSGCKLSKSGEVEIDIAIAIQTGPVFRIGKITASDVPFNKAESLLTIAGLKTGDILSTKTLTDSRGRILKHGLFGSAVVFEGSEQLALSENEKGEKEVFRDINIVVLRQQNWNLTLNPSWNSDRGYGFNTEFQRNNLTIDGLQFLFHSSITQEPYQNTTSNGRHFGQVPGLNMSAGLREALFRVGPFYTPLDFNFVTLGQEVDVRDERRATSRLQSDIAWRPFSFDMEFVHKLELSYAFSGYPLGGVSKPVKIVDNANNVGTVEISASTSVDTRNNPVWPRNGFTLSLGFSHSNPTLGSDFSFNKTSVDGSLFFPWSRQWTQALFLGVKQVSNVSAPGGRREKISSAQVRGFPAMDSQLGPLLWYLEKDSYGRCAAKLAQAAATNLVSTRVETRYRPSQSSWGAALFYDIASSYFAPGEISKLNSQLAAIPAGTDPLCPANTSRVIGNDAVNFDPTSESFWAHSIASSYHSAGVGFRLFLADMFALHLDWGIPTHDPNGSNTQCAPFAEPYQTKGTTTSVPTAPTCISRKPQYLRSWDSPQNALRNALGFIMRTQISIEGKF